MIVTSIEKQKKKGRYNLYLDGDFAFGIYEETLLKFRLRKNDELNEEKIEEIKDIDEFNYGKKSAFDSLAKSSKSESEIRTRLKKKKISEANILKVIEKLKDMNLLDDRKYAIQFLQERLSKKPIGKKVVFSKLMQKGIKREVIEEIIHEYYKDDAEEEKIEKIIQQKLKNPKESIKRILKQKIIQHLMLKGFSYDDIRDCINKYF